jgi:hypothetical protein
MRRRRPVRGVYGTEVELWGKGVRFSDFDGDEFGIWAVGASA